MRFIIIAISFLFLPVGQAAFGCTVSPPELSKHHRDLIADSLQIALVRVVGSSENNHDAVLVTQDRLGDDAGTLAIFEPIRVLKGDVPKRFILSGGHLIKAIDDAVRDMNGHRNLGFWTKKTTQTRSFSGSDCAMHPGFVLGRIYLVFLDHPHLKAYEEIRSKKDLWLQAVQQVIEEPNTQSGITMSIEDWLSMSTGAFKGSVQSCDGPVLWVDEALKGAFPKFLGFHFWWRYRENNETGHWNAGLCVEGNDYLVLTSHDEATRLPYGDSVVAPIMDGSVSLRAAVEASEIPMAGDPLISMDDVRALFKDIPE